MVIEFTKEKWMSGFIPYHKLCINTLPPSYNYYKGYIVLLQPCADQHNLIKINMLFTSTDTLVPTITNI